MADTNDLATALAERDDARAALARVEALCDDVLLLLDRTGLVDPADVREIRAAALSPVPRQDWRCGKCEGGTFPLHSRHCPKRREARTVIWHLMCHGSASCFDCKDARALLDPATQ